MGNVKDRKNTYDVRYMRKKSLLSEYEERRKSIYKFHMAGGSAKFDWEAYFRDIAKLKAEFELRLAGIRGNFHENN